jgi:5'-nucleotidase
VLVTHCGVEVDKQLAQSLADVDVIIGGHSHTRLDVPIWVEHGDGTKTIIVQTGSYGRTLGKLDLAFDARGELIEAQTRDHLINITDRIREDADVAAYISEKAAPLESLKQEIVGYAEGEFDNRFANIPWDSSIGDLISDALADDGTAYGATISFQNRGGIRARIDRGAITEEKVREMLPFDNKVVLATISGRCLLNILEHSFSGPLGGSFLDVHGLKVGYDPQKPKNQRIVFILAQDDHGDWKPIDAHAHYKIAVNDYTFKGGEGYDFSEASDVVYLSDLLSQAFHKYLIKRKNVCPNLPNRIVPLSDNLTQLVSTPRKCLLVHLPNPRCKVTVLFGKDLGVEPVASVAKTPLPVPLERLHIEKALRRIPERQSLSFDLSPFSADSEDQYVAVICRPQGTTSAKAVQVSYPVCISARSMSTH